MLKWTVWSLTVVFLVLMYVLLHSHLFFIPMVALGAMYIMVAMRSSLVDEESWLPEGMRSFLNLVSQGRLIILPIVFFFSAFQFFSYLGWLYTPPPPQTLNELEVVYGVITWNQAITKRSWFTLRTSEGEKLRLGYSGNLARGHDLETSVKQKQLAKVWFSKPRVGPWQVKTDNKLAKQVEINGELFLKYRYDLEKERYERHRSGPPISGIILMLSCFCMVLAYCRYRRSLISDDSEDMPARVNSQ